MNNEFANNETVEKTIIKILQCPDIKWAEEKINDNETSLDICTPDGGNSITVTQYTTPGEKLPRLKLVFKHNSSADCYFAADMDFESKSEIRSCKKKDLYNACENLFTRFYSEKEEAVLNILHQFFPDYQHENN